MEVEKLSITLDNPVGTLDAGTIAAGSVISAFEKGKSGLSKNSKDYLYVQTIQGGETITGLVLANDVKPT